MAGFFVILGTGCDNFYNDILNPPPMVDVIYVKSSAAGSGDGTSWENAFTDLQAGIDAAAADPVRKSVWVAAGTYRPAGNPNNITNAAAGREYHFTLRNGVSLYGGFDGYSNRISDRDPAAHETILSGDIGTENDESDNCLHVFYHPASISLDATALLDGFTITGGNADDTAGTGEHAKGGGMYIDNCRPAVTGCVFKNNRAVNGGAFYINVSGSTVMNLSGNSFSENSTSEKGGAIYISAIEEAEITLSEFSIRMNSASDYGGGIYCWSAGTGSVTITGSTFEGNSSASTGSGGALCIQGSDNAVISIDSSSFTGNMADTNGGAVYVTNEIKSSTEIKGSTFSGNYCGEKGGALYNSIDDDASITVSESVFTGNGIDESDQVKTDSGGAIYNYITKPASDYTKITMSNLTVAGNRALNDGGGIYTVSVAAGDTAVARVDILSCRIENNSAGSDGGGVYNLLETKTRMMVEATQFISNTGGAYGGGLAVYVDGGADSTFIVSRSVFDTNSAPIGGGIAHRSSGSNTSFGIISSVFYGNSASSEGGGCFVDENIVNATFLGTTFLSNSSPAGGDLHCDKQILGYSFIWSSVDLTGFGGDLTVRPDEVIFVDRDNPRGPDGIWGTDDDGLIPVLNSVKVIDEGNEAKYDEKQYGLPQIDLNLDGNYDDNLLPTALDLRGKPRANGIVDIGAYEYHGD